MTILSIGEILWDVFPDSSRLGGAPFNFAVHAHRLGHRVAFLSAVGDDELGAAALAQASALGMDTQFIQVTPHAATGRASIHLDSTGQPDFTIHRPAAYDLLDLDSAQLASLASLNPEWIYFGTLFLMDANAHLQLRRLIHAFPAARLFYDVNLRRGSYTPDLVRDFMSRAHVVKLNQEEAELFPGFTTTWAAAVTRGEHGCDVRIGADSAVCPAAKIHVVDTVGAGDAFAAAFLHGIASGWTAARTGAFANRLGGLVASRAGALPPWSLADLE